MADTGTAGTTANPDSEAEKTGAKAADEARGTTAGAESRPSKSAEGTKDVLSAFLKASGYDKKDVLAHNERTRVFVTENGGKYEMTKKGTIRVQKGPYFPNWEPAAENV